MTLAVHFSTDESERKDWRLTQQSLFTQGTYFQSQWRASTSAKISQLREAQAELSLVFKHCSTSAYPRPVDSAHRIIDESQSLIELCQRLGIQWAVRISSTFDGSIGELFPHSWGVLICGEPGEEEDMIMYMERDQLVYCEVLDKLIRPQVISGVVR